jgi:uncharacterized delta-60 repeat protein
MLSVRYFKFTWQKFRDLIQLGFILCISLGPLGCSLNSGSTETSPTSSTSPFKINTDIGTNSDDWANALATQSDGKILVAGGSNAGGPSYNFTVVRYNIDSTLDTSFGTGGKVTTDIGTNSTDFAFTIVLQSDGKILLAGWSSSGGPKNIAVVRYNSDGTLDASFGTGGKVTTDIGTNSDDWTTAMAVQSDGKILVAGKSDAGGSWDFSVVRYNSDGTLDASFGTGGKVTTDIGTNSNDPANAMAVQSDGKILVAGYSDASGAGDFVVVRYSSNGTLDASFGTGGKVITDIGTNSGDQATAMAVQSDGKILVSGASSAGIGSDFAVLRYNSDGTLDASFGTGGKVTTNIDTGSTDWPYAMSLKSDGKIVLAGTFVTTGSWDFSVIRYNSNGTLDTSFGTGGTLTTDIGTGTDDAAYGVLFESDGKILVTGYSDAGDPGNTYDFVLMRLLATGQ